MSPWLDSEALITLHSHRPFSTLMGQCVVRSRPIVPISLYGFVSLEKAGNDAGPQDMLIRLYSLRGGQYLKFLGSCRPFTKS